MARIVSAVVLVWVLLPSQNAAAHYLWLQLDAATGANGSINLCFEEGPRIGDGQYLDPFVERGKAWIRTADNLQPEPLKLVEKKKDKKRWLTAELTSAAPRVASSYCRWGVYRYGKTDILLHYYARRFDVSSPDQLKTLARAEHLDLDIVPKWDDGSMQLQVLWQGEPAADRPVYLRGPGAGGELKTDGKGNAVFAVKKRGRYLLRTYVELDEEGTENDKAYQQIRHWCTLAIDLPLAPK